MIVDSHCHLDFPDFAGERDELIARAHEAGVDLMVSICTKVREFEQVKAIAETYDNVFCSVGTHPMQAGEEADITADEIEVMARHPKVVAIGESGLDYFYDSAPHDVQQRVLRRDIEVSRRTQLPLVIHSRDADEDMLAILSEEMEKGAFPALLHCFSSGRALAMGALELGLYISFSGILTFKKSQEIRDIAKEIPSDRILVETDSPYLAPVPKRGKRNEPAFTAYTAGVLAETRGVSKEEIAAQTTENFFRLFSKVPRSAMKSARTSATTNGEGAA